MTAAADPSPHPAPCVWCGGHAWLVTRWADNQLTFRCADPTCPGWGLCDECPECGSVLWVELGPGILRCGNWHCLSNHHGH